MINDERDPETYALIGAAIEVYNQLGCGFVELPYQLAFASELELRGIPYERELPIIVSYKGRTLACGYKADFVCNGAVLVELKVADEIIDKHRSQVINYLKATGLNRALILNFGKSRLEWERVVLDF